MSEAGQQQYRLTPEGRFAIWIVAGEIVVFAIVCWLFTAQIALGACITFASVALAMRLVWAERVHVWYWLFSVIAVLGQIPLIRQFPWGNREYRPLVFILAAADFVVVWGFLKLGQLALSKRS